MTAKSSIRPAERSARPVAALWRWSPCIVALASLFVVYGYIFFINDKGFFVDEVFLVNSSRFSFYYRDHGILPTTFAGFALWPLFHAFQGDLLLLRCATFLISTGVFLAYALAFAKRLHATDSAQSSLAPARMCANAYDTGAHGHRAVLAHLLERIDPRL